MSMEVSITIGNAILRLKRGQIKHWFRLLGPPPVSPAQSPPLAGFVALGQARNRNAFVGGWSPAIPLWLVWKVYDSFVFTVSVSGQRVVWPVLDEDTMFGFFVFFFSCTAFKHPH